MIIALALLLICQQPAPSGAGSHTICFSPGADCLKRIRQEIDQARESVLVQAYSFTSLEIAEALIRARKRGLRVEVIIDGPRAAERDSQASACARGGVTVLVDEDHRIAHNKIMIIDSRAVVTGSLNFTSEADERNAENTLILRDERLAAVYTRNYDRHRKHSHAYIKE